MIAHLWAKGWAASAGGCLLLAALTAGGCGPAKGNISGVVKLPDGSRLTAGEVTFYSQGSVKKVASSTLTDGHYSIPNFHAGPVKVTVRAITDQGEAVEMPEGMSAPRQGPGGGPKGPQHDDTQTDAKPVKLNPRYNDPDKSKLDFEVTRGDQEHDIELKP